MARARLQAAGTGLEAASRLIGARADDLAAREAALANRVERFAERHDALGRATERTAAGLAALDPQLSQAVLRLDGMEAEMTRQGAGFQGKVEAAEQRVRALGDVLARHGDGLEASRTAAEQFRAAMEARLQGLDAMAVAVAAKSDDLLQAIGSQRQALDAGIGAGEEFAAMAARLDERAATLAATARAGGADMAEAGRAFDAAEARLVVLGSGIDRLAGTVGEADGLARETTRSLAAAGGQARAEIEALGEAGDAAHAALEEGGRRAEAARTELARTAGALEAAMGRGARAVETATTALVGEGDRGGEAARRLAADIDALNTVAREGEKRLGEGARELDGRVRELHADTSVELGRLAEAGLELGRRQEWLSGLLTKLIASVDGTENHFDQRAETLTRKAREAGEAMAGAGDLANERAAMLETRLMGLSATTETLVSRLARHLESLEALASQAPTDEEMAADARAAEFLASLAQVGDAVGAMGLDLAQLDADESTDAGFLGKFKRRGAAAAGAGPRLAQEFGENAAFRAQADSYLAAFGVFMDGVARDGQGNVTRTLMLGSDVGKLFRLLRRVRDEA